MTKEQEEALKTMQHWINYEKENKNKINKADELIKIQETVLNMLKEKEERIEYLQRSCERKEQSLIEEQQENVDLTAKIEKKDKEIEKLKEFINWLQLKNNKNLDIKIYMANFINNNTPYTKNTKELEDEEGKRTVDFTIQYFERKVEEER